MAVSTASLSAPTGLTASATCSLIPSKVTVNLSWTATSSTFADGYEVFRSTSGGAYASVGTVTGRTTTAFTDNTVTFSTSYSYVVRASRNNWRSGDSNVASVTTKSSLCL